MIKKLIVILDNKQYLISMSQKQWNSRPNKDIKVFDASAVVKV